MNIAYVVELKWGKVVIAKFSYEKKTDKNYMGCRNLATWPNSAFCYISSRVSHAGCEESIDAALAKAKELLVEAEWKAERDIQRIREQSGKLLSAREQLERD